jgi:putative SOS response-associated peptidase YedK
VSDRVVAAFWSSPEDIAAVEVTISDATAERVVGRTNIAPTQPMLAVVNGENGEREAILARFGLAPTRQTVLHALAGGDAMTAGHLAAATGLRRETTAPELSKLVRTGQLCKADRDYKTAANVAPLPANA